MTKKQIAAALLLWLVPLASIVTQAQAVTPSTLDKTNVVNASAGKLSLNAQASAEVPQDTVYIALFYEEQASDPAVLTEKLKRKADQALHDARSQTKVSVQTAGFTVYPSADREGRITGWRGRTGLLLQSNDFTAAAQLAGKLSPIMQISSVRFSLSPQATREAQTKLTTEAILAFRNQAELAVKAFGFNRYAIHEVELHRNGIIAPQPMMLATAHAMSGSAADMPLEAGKSTVTVSVSGSVQMLR